MKITNIHSDFRGSIKAITGDPLSCPEVAILYTEAGMARGGCIHRKNKEHLCVIQGVIEYVWGEEKNHKMLKAGQSMTIDANVPHFLVSLTDSIVVEWGTTLEEKKEKYLPFRETVNNINKNHEN